MIETESVQVDDAAGNGCSSPDIADTPLQHIAIIMDGNNRWAREQGLPGSEGHRAGARALKATVENCARLNIQALTVFAFSSENWRRPISEVNVLMSLFMEALQSEVEALHQNQIKLNFIGDLSAFSLELRQSMAAAEALTAENKRLIFNVAVNYGGRWDIVQAARSVAQLAIEGDIHPSEINEDLLDQHTALVGQPPVDLCIRTSGEERISNFLLWQIAYSEIYFAQCLWPDFDAVELGAAIQEYNSRQRRFGRTSEQLQNEQPQNSAVETSIGSAIESAAEISVERTLC